MLHLELRQLLELLDALAPPLTHVLKLNWHIIMAEANPGGDQHNDDSSDYPSEQDEDSDIGEEGYYFGTLPASEEIALQQMRDAYAEALRMQAHQPQPDQDQEQRSNQDADGA